MIMRGPCEWDHGAAPLDVDEYICPVAGHDARPSPRAHHTRHDVSLLRIVCSAGRRYLRGDREALSYHYRPTCRLESKPDFHLLEPPTLGCILHCRPSSFLIRGNVDDGQRERVYLDHFGGSNHDRVALNHP
jgi:hypothetical protein